MFQSCPLFSLAMMMVWISLGPPANAELGGAQDAARVVDEASPGTPYFCTVKDMPTSWQPNGRPVEIIRNGGVFTQLGTVTAELDVRNVGSLPITSLVLVIEYMDKPGRRLATATPTGAIEGADRLLNLPFAIEDTLIWSHTLDPGQTARLTGLYDSAAMTICPNQARITFAKVRFKNGAVQQYASPEWQVPALPRMVPRLDSACPSVQGGLEEIPATLRISAHGDVVGISPDNAGHLDAFYWAATQLKSWTFHPAVVDGQPAESELRVLLVFYAGPEVNLATVSVESPAVLIGFVPSDRDTPPRCVEAFANLTENGTVP